MVEDLCFRGSSKPADATLNIAVWQGRLHPPWTPGFFTPQAARRATRPKSPS